MDVNLVKNKFIVGLTGGFASGKTTVSDYLEKLGAFVVDADAISRKVVAPDSETNSKIKSLLGAEFFTITGELARAKIKQAIFADEKLRKQYESIVFPAIRNELLKELNSAPQSSCYVLLSAPLLFENGLDKYTKYNIVVDVPAEMQLERALVRENISQNTAQQIISAQMSRDLRNNKANIIVSNVGNVTHLYIQLDRIHCRLLELASIY